MSDEIQVIPANDAEFTNEKVLHRLIQVEKDTKEILTIMRELQQLTKQIPELLSGGGIGALMGGGPMGAIVSSLTKRK